MPKKSKTEAQQQPTTILLIRHGENEWTESHKLAGRAPGVHLNKYGRQQAEALGKRLAKVKLKAIYTSPLERTLETAQAIAQYHELEIEAHDGLLEVDYGDWTGEKIKKLVKTPQWLAIQFYPSGASFPQGESMYGMQARFVQEINHLVARHPGETMAIVGHADLIKAAVAHYLGMHLDLFQRIVISTASITTISFTPMGPRVVSVNDTNHVPPRPVKQKKTKSQKTRGV
ncbi:MAG: MSMEG_4193 family putative phosphomutase [Anaerolineae bacterium]|nr:MSMEG_4193 family putative phosphomutase [Anaerolineae bacterium]